MMTGKKDMHIYQCLAVASFIALTIALPSVPSDEKGKVEVRSGYTYDSRVDNYVKFTYPAVVPPMQKCYLHGSVTR